MRSRRGVTLIEIAIVVAIIGVLASIGAGMLTKIIPSWRTRRAAMDFATAVSEARAMAIADNKQYRVHVTTGDPDTTSGTDNYGEYWVQRGDAASDTTAWDTLPVDMSGSDDVFEQGYVNIQKDQEDSLPGVSLREFTTPLTGVDGWSDSLVFGPRGLLDNPPDDFGCDINSDGSSDGYICVTFVNKKAAVEGQTDEWNVLISRAGMVRLQHGESGDDAVGYPAGSSITSTPGSTPTGYQGG